MSDFRRKLFEWLDPDWLEEAGLFPVPGHHHGHLDHGSDHEHDNGLGNHDGECVKDDNEVDEDSHLHCAPRCGWWGGKPQ